MHSLKYCGSKNTSVFRQVSSATKTEYTRGNLHHTHGHLYLSVVMGQRLHRIPGKRILNFSWALHLNEHPAPRTTATIKRQDAVWWCANEWVVGVNEQPMFLGFGAVAFGTQIWRRCCLASSSMRCPLAIAADWNLLNRKTVSEVRLGCAARVL